MDKKTRIKLLVSLAITVSLAGLIAFSVESRFYQILELKALDLRFAFKGNSPSFSPILHVDIDDQSLSALGRWPWPRDYHAKLTSILKECGARQILMDIIFTEEFKDQPQQDLSFAEEIKKAGITFLPFYFIEKQSSVSPELEALLLKDISLSAEDAAKSLKVHPQSLRESLPQIKKMLLEEAVHDILHKEPDISVEGLLQRMEEEYGWFLFVENENFVRERFAPQKLLRYFISRFAISLPDQKWPFKKEDRSFNVPIRAFAENIRGSGFINTEPDIDGVTRKVPLLVQYEDKLLPQLTVAALLDLLEVKKIQTCQDKIIFKDASLNGKQKDIVIPVDRNGSMLINWRGRWGASFKHLPYYLILRLSDIRQQLDVKMGELDQAGTSSQNAGAIEYMKKSEAELLKKLTAMVNGKICIVGLTATGTHDLRPIPLQENYPMVGVHSNLIDTILTERFIVRKQGMFRLVIFLVTALVISFASLLKLGRSLLVSTGYVTAYFLVCLFLFIRFGLWIDLVGPLAITVFGFSGITSYRFFTEEKEKLWIKKAFSHYISDQVISELLDNPSMLKLGGERRTITVLFSDVRGFTSFSESHQPEEVVAMLNEILSAQVKVVFKYNGTLDKFVGDELMAFFGAPGNQHLKDHALVCVRTAVEIQKRMQELQKSWSGENKEALEIGIGINTGEMVVGNIGSSERMDYTVIGDNVNLAARLCSAASKDEIIISEATYNMVSEYVLAEKLEPIQVKGKSKPISIYRVLDLKQEKYKA